MSSVELTFVKVEEFEGLKAAPLDVQAQALVTTHRSEDPRR